MASDNLKRKLAARAEAAEVLRINPKFSVDNYSNNFYNYKNQSLINEYLARLRKAGLK